MANPTTSRPTWQRGRAFRFFASVKLAVVLLAVLIAGAIAGTLYESTFDAKVARAYIYGAPWFNIWLLLLAANLIVSALSRWPWKKHHVAFLITHLGIITLLAGSLIGRTFGVEGTMTLFKGEPPTNRLLVDEHQLRVRDTDGIVKGYPVELVHRPPTTEKPWDLGVLASGARLSVVGYAPAIEGKLNPKPLPDGGVPALHFTIATAMMNQHLESWLLADDQQHGSFNMGLANIALKRGVAPQSSGAAMPSPNASKTAEAVDIEESIFAFAKAADQQIAKALKGGSTAAKVRLSVPSNGGKGSITIEVAGKSATISVAENIGKDVPLEGTPFTARIDNYWPDFRIENNKPASVSDQPNNPAVVVTLRGKAVPAIAPAAPHTGSGAAPPMPATGDPSVNHLTLFVADDGSISYELASRKAGASTGKLEAGRPLSTGWADWELTVDRTVPHAAEWMDFNPVTAAPEGTELPDGVLVRVRQDGKSFAQWVPSGWQISIPTSPAEVQVAYGWRQVPLPIGLELMEFEVQRNEGSDSPAGFKSTVRVSTPEGATATGQCWMNHPFSFPGEMWRTWTGLTYKMSQASWNPENLGQSTIQILRDPGWLLKWIGSLLIVSGIFMLFYLKGFRRPSAAAPPIRPTQQSGRKPREQALA
ncbi:MAG: cytochrome c biogenesis protein ResB [Verrucomicrobiota bacterium]|nr:cytochrome c biogenesis protein ResB [Verrucomicrobiota bacterium]